jgi:1,2-phenylacetyl-CoA epoxidase PaaB subunit
MDYINKVRESRAEEAWPRWRLFHGGFNNAEHLRLGRWHAPSRQCPFAWCKTFGPNALIRG